MEKQFQQSIQRVEELISEIELVADPDTRAKALELVQSLMDFHGAGLDRMMERISEAGEAGASLFDDFARDDLVASMLLLYGLHPLDFETRIQQALDKVRPYLASHGGNVELLNVAEGVVRLKLEGSCHGCPSSAMTLKLAIEEAIYEAAPDTIALEVEGVVEQQPKPLTPTFVQLRGPASSNSSQPAKQNGKGKWEEVSGLESLAHSSVRALEVSGQSILFCRLGETFYAYQSLCPGCGQALHLARLEANNLVCPACSQSYDVVRAGRGTSMPNLQLEPFPLLIEQGQAKIALPH